jgi:hypothetical protein
MPTLVSRCVGFKIPPLRRDEILSALREKRPELSRHDAELIAGLSGGALGMALETESEKAVSMRLSIEEVFSRPPGPARLSAGMRLAYSMASV